MVFSQISDQTVIVCNYWDHTWNMIVVVILGGGANIDGKDGSGEDDGYNDIQLSMTTMSILSVSTTTQDRLIVISS